MKGGARREAGMVAGSDFSLCAAMQSSDHSQVLQVWQASSADERRRHCPLLPTLLSSSGHLWDRHLLAGSYTLPLPSSTAWMAASPAATATSPALDTEGSFAPAVFSSIFASCTHARVLHACLDIGVAVGCLRISPDARRGFGWLLYLLVCSSRDIHFRA